MRNVSILIKTKIILNFLCIISHSAHVSLMQNLLKRRRKTQEIVFHSPSQEVTPKWESGELRVTTASAATDREMP